MHSHNQLIIWPRKRWNDEKKRGKKEFFITNYYLHNIFPLWVDSLANYYIIASKGEDKYEKKIEIKFYQWMTRLIYQISGKIINMTTIRKSVVSSSREQNMERNLQVELSKSMLHSIKTADRFYSKLKSDKKTSTIATIFSNRYDNNDNNEKIAKNEKNEKNDRQKRKKDKKRDEEDNSRIEMMKEFIDLQSQPTSFSFCNTYFSDWEKSIE